MVPYARLFKTALRFSAIAMLSGLPIYAAGIGATATFTDVADPSLAGVYDYSITLNNTGTTTIGTFWFAWVPGAGFLSATPSSIGSPTAWSDVNTNGGKGIRWTSTTALLQAGQSLSGFTFDSTETPAQLLANYTGTGTGAGDPVTTSFVYIDAPLADPGAQLTVTAATPEPSSLLLLATGLLGGAGACYRRFQNARTA